MSSNELWQICHSNGSKSLRIKRNKKLTAKIVAILTVRRMTPKGVAADCQMPVERVRNWFFKGIGMTALDVIELAKHYEAIRIFVMEAISPSSSGH
jgi:tartrate dehydratase beta subunit/fumarate hydratase class I family protein